jgi:hypothetical protein
MLAASRCSSQVSRPNLPTRCGTDRRVKVCSLLSQKNGIFYNGFRGSAEQPHMHLALHAILKIRKPPRSFCWIWHFSRGQLIATNSAKALVQGITNSSGNNLASVSRSWNCGYALPGMPSNEGGWIGCALVRRLLQCTAPLNKAGFWTESAFGDAGEPGRPGRRTTSGESQQQDWEPQTPKP